MRKVTTTREYIVHLPQSQVGVKEGLSQHVLQQHYWQEYQSLQVGLLDKWLLLKQHYLEGTSPATVPIPYLMPASFRDNWIPSVFHKLIRPIKKMMNENNYQHMLLQI